MVEFVMGCVREMNKEVENPVICEVYMRGVLKFHEVISTA